MFPCFLLLILLSISKALAEPAMHDITRANPKPPILLNRSGGFKIGGKVIQSPFSRTQTLHCDHGYVEYFVPQRPRRTSIVMWHSASTQAFQNRWDGGEGFKDLYLRRNYPVYLWDGPRVGRANWACNSTSPDEAWACGRLAIRCWLSTVSCVNSTWKSRASSKSAITRRR